MLQKQQNGLKKNKIKTIIGFCSLATLLIMNWLHCNRQYTLCGPFKRDLSIVVSFRSPGKIVTVHLNDVPNESAFTEAIEFLEEITRKCMNTHTRAGRPKVVRAV